MTLDSEVNRNLENTENTGGDGGSEAGPYGWKVLQLRSQPWWKTAVFTLVLLGLLALAFAAFRSWIVVAAFVVALFLTFEDYIFPLRFEIGPEGVSSRGAIFHRRVMKWADIRRCAANDYGVLCSPFEKPSRFDGIRGVFLRFGRSNREEVIANVRRFRDAAGAAS
ncbi:MAG: hypothetical protein ACYS8W_00365 [Planctomycetota bacterium]|jgi:hypothetical protein